MYTDSEALENTKWLDGAVTYIWLDVQRPKETPEARQALSPRDLYHFCLSQYLNKSYLQSNTHHIHPRLPQVKVSVSDTKFPYLE
jgi:hypothetical protein